MKVLLTEHQLNTLLQEESVARFLQESLQEIKNLKSLKKYIKNLILSGIAISTIIAAINKSDTSENEKRELINAAMSVSETEKTDTVFQQKVSAVKKYMEAALKNQGYSLSSTDLEPEALVKASIEKNFDLIG